MWTAPGLQEIGGRVKRIACDHMSGLLSRPHMAAGQDGFHKASPKHTRDVLAPRDPTGCLGSWTHRSHHLLRLKQASGPPRSGDALPVKFYARAALVLTAGRHDAMRAHGTRSEALSKRSAAARRCGGHTARIMAFAADHQLPDPQRTAVASRFYLAVNLRPWSTPRSRGGNVPVWRIAVETADMAISTQMTQADTWLAVCGARFHSGTGVY